ncbi:Glucanase [Colletotrichum higginsianum IMI 349063]|uniref:Glucanase n=1 Tax=Colletotrichum higginsianum (strain IMI 349063) TaxID=759273 RepID=A0A1B7XSH4_COLHI|nr:Glucanase [Colletotrichum higginsianum IMI 349063]OBR02712.1 Glucanase [Colletotrichum higginsianum IMI 349063]
MSEFFDIFKDIFGDNTEFQDVGGWAKMGDVVRNFMVLVTIDSAYALDRYKCEPDVAPGPCLRNSGNPTMFANYRERKAKVFNRFCNCRAMFTPK